MKGKIVVITGASSGIGKALAFEFGSKGATVVISARNVEMLQQVSDELLAQKIENLIVQADVSKEQDCENLIQLTVAKYGRIDVLINNAGISMRALFADLQLDVMRRLMDTNFWGTVYCTKYALPYILQSHGSVVGIISVAGHLGLPARTGYSASKYAIRGFLDALRAENYNNKLHVLVVAPGFTASNIRKTALVANGAQQGETPRVEEKMMTAETAAHKIYLGVVRRKRQMLLTFGDGKFPVFLKCIAPALLDKLLFKVMAKEPDSPLKK